MERNNKNNKCLIRVSSFRNVSELFDSHVIELNAPDFPRKKLGRERGDNFEKKFFELRITLDSYYSGEGNR